MHADPFPSRLAAAHDCILSAWATGPFFSLPCHVLLILLSTIYLLLLSTHPRLRIPICICIRAQVRAQSCEHQHSTRLVSSHEKKKAFPCASLRCILDRSLSGAYSVHALAGKMCLLRSYHRLSTTLVSVASSPNPSSSSSAMLDSLLFFLPGCSSGSYVAGSTSASSSTSVVTLGVALVGCAE